MHAYRYPLASKKVDESLFQPSPEFRKQISRVIKSIYIFIATYILLIVTALMLFVACALGGLWLLSAYPSIWTFLGGIGMVCFGGLVVYFLLKFAFKSQSTDQSQMLKVTKKEHPLLFDFIEKVAKETGASMPKRIFLSRDVNAFVFYDSSFWSMFFPVRKNLSIGLGLVNSVNITEFKAIIAHEFGHFSQKSMRLGSYVYHVNHVLHDVLHDNAGYEKTLQGLANIGALFSFFADITNFVVSTIQDILKDQFERINERYMALSREMEFHADTIAASVSGSTPLCDALYRLEVAQLCYERLLVFYDGALRENRKCANLYPQHTFLMHAFADAHNLELHNGLVSVTSDTFSRYDKGRVVITNQWASHPETKEREKRLLALQLKADVVAAPAWTLFNSPEGVQQELTHRMYEHIPFTTSPDLIDLEQFSMKHQEDTARYSFHTSYRGYYDNRNITPFDLQAALMEPLKTGRITDIITDDALSWQYTRAGLTKDIEILECLEPKSSPIKTFDFEGKKYHREEASSLLPQLREELKEITRRQDEADKEIFKLLCNTVNKQEGVLLYEKLFKTYELQNGLLADVQSMINEVVQLYEPEVSYGKAVAVTNNMNRKAPALKMRMSEQLQQFDIFRFCAPGEVSCLESYLHDSREYLVNDRLDTEAINLFMQANHVFINGLFEFLFEQRKAVFDRQAELLTPDALVVNQRRELKG